VRKPQFESEPLKDNTDNILDDGNVHGTFSRANHLQWAIVRQLNCFLQYCRHFTAGRPHHELHGSNYQLERVTPGR
jgi:hypothetical protein